MASTVRPDVCRDLRDVITQFAAKSEETLSARPEPVDFRTDARHLVEQPACRAWIAHACRTHPHVTEASAEAAIVSFFVDVVHAACGCLCLAHWQFITRLLQPILSFPLKAIRLLMPGDELREAVLEPMAWFFLDSLRDLRSDPNRLRSGQDDENKLVTRPYGWSPSWDSLEGSLSLLIIRQTRRRYWPNAFIFSPLGYWLRSSGLAQTVDVERHVCSRCVKEFPERSTAGRCPECGAPIIVKRGTQLLATKYLENQFRRSVSSHSPRFIGQLHAAEAAREAAARAHAEPPSQRMLQSESSQRDWRIALSRTRELWDKTATGSRLNLSKIVVLLTLAGLTAVPTREQLCRPKAGWLRTIVQRFLENSVNRHVVMANARLLLPQLCRMLGVTEDVTLNVGHTSSILCRFKGCILG